MILSYMQPFMLWCLEVHDINQMSICNEVQAAYWAFAPFQTSFLGLIRLNEFQLAHHSLHEHRGFTCSPMAFVILILLVLNTYLGKQYIFKVFASINLCLSIISGGISLASNESVFVTMKVQRLLYNRIKYAATFSKQRYSKQKCCAKS